MNLADLWLLPVRGLHLHRRVRCPWGCSWEERVWTQRGELLARDCHGAVCPSRSLSSGGTRREVL
jgi:hypothetical protein